MMLMSLVTFNTEKDSQVSFDFIYTIHGQYHHQSGYTERRRVIHPEALL